MDIANFSLLPVYLSEALFYFAWSIAGYLAWRVVRAYERRSLEAARTRTLRKRIRRLEASMGRVQRRVTWTADAQRFTTALLLKRPEPETAHDGSQRNRAGRGVE